VFPALSPAAEEIPLVARGGPFPARGVGSPQRGRSAADVAGGAHHDAAHACEIALQPHVSDPVRSISVFFQGRWCRMWFNKCSEPPCDMRARPVGDGPAKMGRIKTTDHESQATVLVRQTHTEFPQHKKCRSEPIAKKKKKMVDRRDARPNMSSTPQKKHNASAVIHICWVR